jgi:hypothetical protein
MPFDITMPELITNFKLQFALTLRDAFADSDDLVGKVAVLGTVAGRRKDFSGAFLFDGLRAGAQDLAVSSADDTPYYLPKKVPVTIPVPAPPLPAPQYPWPVFPDKRLANPNLPLRDPGQPQEYRDQRAAATLWPSIAYPFPAGATLIRGTVTHGGPGNPLDQASVQQVGSTDPAYLTGKDGQFVLYWEQAPSIPKQVTLRVTAAGGLGPKNQNLTVTRGLTNLVDIDL